MAFPRPLKPWLSRSPGAVFTLYAMFVAFSTYFCMYAYRKPFAAAKFEGLKFLGTEVDLKTAFVISQIVGYTLSKYIGVKLCSEISPGRRALALLGLIGIALGALLLFGLLPTQWKVVAIFVNGLPLGMVWGMVVGYLEGRRSSEILLAGLSSSFIVASGFVKDAGRFIIDGFGVAEAWMPFTTGLVFLPFFVLSVWLLDQLPAPSQEDIAARVERKPMDSADRMRFIREFALGLFLLLVVYFFLTAYRDFRDNYAVEIFADLGYAGQPAMFTRTELPVALCVLLVMAALNLIKDNRRGLMGAFGVMTLGVLLLAGGTFVHGLGLISGLVWMVSTGLGAFLAYVPFNSVLFDRMIAATGVTGTAVFAIYVADAAGYTGSIGVQLFRDLVLGDSSRLVFFTGFTYFMAGIGVVCLFLSATWFARRTGQGRAG